MNGVNPAVKRFGRAGSAALLIAACWSAALVVGAFFVPVYQSTGGPSSTAPAGPPGTLVGVNGLGAVALVGVPLAVTLAVGCALALRSRRGAMPLAWTLTGLLAAFNLLAIMSVGIFILPATAALIVACSSCRSRSGLFMPASPHGDTTLPNGTL